MATILCLTVFFLSMVHANAQQCSLKPSGIFTLASSNELSLNININETMASFHYVEPVFTIYLIRIRRYVSHCKPHMYSGELSTCQGKTTMLQLTDEEIKNIKETGRCKIGETCRVEVGCTVGSNDECTNDERSYYTPHRSFEFQDKRYSNRWTYACTQDWECVIEPFAAKVRTVKVSDFTGFVLELNGQEIRLEKGKNIYRLPIMNVYIPDFKITSGVIKTKCISSSDRVVCIITETKDGLNIGETFIVDSDGEASMDNYQFKVDIASIEQHFKYHSGHGASVEMLEKTISGMLFNQHQNLYNVAILHRRLTNLEKTMLTQIEVQSKKDEMAMGKYLGHDVKTKWLDDRTFTLYPCEPSMPDTMCEKLAIGKKCGLNATEIRIFRNDSIDATEIGIPAIDESDRSAWNDAMDRLRNETEKEKRVTEESTYNRFELFFIDFWAILMKVGSVCGLISFIAILYYGWYKILHS